MSCDAFKLSVNTACYSATAASLVHVLGFFKFEPGAADFPMPAFGCFFLNLFKHGAVAIYAF